MPVGSANPFPSVLMVEGTTPATPGAGNQKAFVRSSDHVLCLVNSSAVVTPVSTGPARELDYVAFTSPVNLTATTEGTANTVVTGSAVVYDGSTVVLIEFFAPGWETAVVTNAVSRLYLYDGASSIGRIGTLVTPIAGTLGVIAPAHCSVRLTPSAATHTYSVRGDTTSGTAIVNVGAGGVGNTMPGFIRITRAV